jgi:phosphoribosyl 1,2-cyclic phosphodiesterase
MAIQFAVLASGSRGNASLVGSGHGGLLIDVGLGPRELVGRLAAVGSAVGRVASAVLTHTHGDHVHPATLRLLASQKIPLHCHEGHRPTLLEKPGALELERVGLLRTYDDRPFLSPSGLQVEPIALSHDGGPTFGFRVEGRGGRGMKPVALGYVADTGTWNERIADALVDVDVLGVEFNHDVALQRASGRSPFLIARNLGPRGHLSNQQAAGRVTAVLGRSRPGSVKNLILLHLSDDCNDPALAMKQAKLAVKNAGRRATIHAASQLEAYPNLTVVAARKRRAAATSTLGLFPWELS